MTPDEFRRFADLFPEPVLLVNGEGGIVALNAAAARNPLPVLQPDVRLTELFEDGEGGASDYLRRCRRSGEPVLGALRWRDAQGQMHSIRCTGRLVAPGAEPNAVQVLLRLATERPPDVNFGLLTRKITELEKALHRRREAEEALRAERERLQVTLASIGDAVMVTDAAGNVTFLNMVAEELTGWTTAEAAGRPLEEVFRIVNEYTRKTVENPVARVIREGQIVGLANHTILIAREGTERPIDDSAAPIRTSDGELAGVVLVFRDVTERKRAEEALRYQYELTKAITDNATTAIFMMDAQSRCTFANPAAEAMTGFRFAELRGEILHDKIHHTHPDGRPYPMRECPIDRALPEHFDVRGHEDVFIRKNGEFFPVVCNARPIQEHGRPVGTVVEVRDVTEEKRSAARLREESQTVETLHRLGTALAAELELDRIVQLVTDEGVALTGAAFGAFFYNKVDERGESYALYALSGAPREAFAQFPMPRNTEIFGPTFRGEGVVRLDDVTADPRYGRNEPYQGMPAGHLPVHSYLAVPVISRSGEVLGGLFLGHPEIARFNDRHERLIVGLAAQAAIAIDNARLFDEARRERAKAEANEERLQLAVAIARMGTFEIDLASDAVTVNETGRAIYGWPADLPLTFSLVQTQFHPDDRAEVLRRVERALDPNGPGEFEVEQRIQRTDGAIRWIRVRGRALFEGEGEQCHAVRCVGIFIDITDAKHAEEAQVEQTRLATMRAEISARLASGDSLAVVLQECAEVLVRRLGAAFARIWTLDEQEQELRLEASAGLYTHLDGPHSRIKVGEYKIGRIARERRPHLTNTVASDPNISDPQWAQREGMVAFAGYPLMVGGRVVGVLAMFAREPLSNAVLDELAPLADGIAQFIERKHSEEALRTSEERLRIALDAGQMGTWDWDIVTDRVTWSQTMTTVFGVPPEAFPRSLASYLEYVHPEDREEVLQRVNGSLRTGERFRVEHRILWPDGSVHWVEGQGKPFYNERRRPIRLAGVSMNIDRRKRSEQNAVFLAEASAVLSTLVDFESTLQKVAGLAVPDFADWCAVDLVDDELELRRVALAHVDPEKVRLGHDLHRRYPPRKDAPIGAYQVLRTGEPEYASHLSDDVLLAAAADEEHRQILRELGLRAYICVPLQVRGRTIGIITFVGAESGRRYDVEDLELAKELARRAAIAIENARLYRELRDADRRKDEFLAMLAHELRNPLAPIRNALALLSAPGVDEAASREAREVMGRQIDHLVRLVDDLLDVSRIMRGRVELRKEPVELKTILDRAIEASLPLLQSQQHEFRVELPDEPIWLDADPIRLAQVFSNLLSNAAKYTEAGGKVTLTAERRPGGVYVCVTDTGIGIEADLLPRVFDLFIQSERSIERSQGGLGIGLSLVKVLVEMHGGAVTAESDGPGRGSTFCVTLPTIASPTPKPQVETHDAAAVPIRPLRVLVVEDMVASARLMATMLERFWSHEVRVAHDGVSAVEAAIEFSPEVVLLDIGLPGMNGYDVAHRLRQRPEHRDTLLVALTGYGQEQDRRLSAEAGFDEHLVKPASVEDLRRVFSHPKLLNAAAESDV